MLEEKGLVCRSTNDQNRRKKLVSLTEKGEETYGRICEIYQAWNDICYRGFSEDERNLNRAFIERISQNVLEFKKENGGRKNG